MDRVREREAFYQKGPRIGNPWLEDQVMQRFVNALMCKANQDVKKSMHQDLEQFGDKCSSVYMRHQENAGRFQPELEQFDTFGRRIDVIHTSEGWKELKKEAAKEGLVAIPYEKPGDEFARIHQALKLIMFTPSGGMVTCPLAMQDGAANVIGKMLAGKGQNNDLPENTRHAIQDAYNRLTSRNLDSAITAGQFFTEKPGGSDLSVSTHTIAIKSKNADEQRFGTHKLFGYKWFTSAIDAQVALTLATVVEDEHHEHAEITKNRKPLSLFFIRTRKDKAQLSEEEQVENPDVLNGIKIVRLKEKMATKQLPTAELVLEGSDAFLLSKEGEGIREVVPMLHITRFHNALGAVGYMIRLRNLAIDWAHSRYAFGSLIVDKPLHLQSLFEYDMDCRGNLLFALEMARLIGLDETGKASKVESTILRMSSSLVKLFTALECSRLASNGIELFGAIGVMENSVSTIFRDCQVLKIWEGSSNIMALDLLRTMKTMPVFREYLLDMAKLVPTEKFVILKESIEKEFQYMSDNASHPDRLEFNILRLSMNLSRIYVTCLIAKMNHQTNEEEKLLNYWLNRVARENEEMSDPKFLEDYRETISSDYNGKARDSRGKLRSYF